MSKKDFIVNVTAEGPGVSAGDMGTIAVIGIDELEPRKVSIGDKIESVDDKLISIVNRIFSQVPAPQEVIIVGGETVTAGLEKLLDSELGFTFIVPTVTDKIKELSDMAKEHFIFIDVTDEAELEALKSNSLDNVFAIASDDGNVAGGLAAIMSKRFGSIDPKFKRVRNAEPGNSLNVEGVNIAEYIKRMGEPMITSSLLNGGEHLDVELGRLWIKRRMEQKLMNIAIKNDKIPYTNRGIGQLVGAVNETLQEATDRDIISNHVVRYKKAEEVAVEDKQNRVYNDLHAEATLVGSIQGGEFNIKLTYSEVAE